jgi:hypothetical protein
MLFPYDLFSLSKSSVRAYSLLSGFYLDARDSLTVVGKFSDSLLLSPRGDSLKKHSLVSTGKMHETSSPSTFMPLADKP